MALLILVTNEDDLWDDLWVAKCEFEFESEFDFDSTSYFKIDFMLILLYLYFVKYNE